MLDVKTDACAGCGVCTRVCPTDAISLDAGKAQIDQNRCISCYHCAQACPRGAIVAVETRLRPAVISSAQELRDNLLHLQEELDMADRRLRRLEQRKAARHM
jgi:ferredoxin